MASATLPPFEYAPLNAGEMRLLCPKVEGDEVKWSLKVSPMPRESPFSCDGEMGQALSKFRLKEKGINDSQLRDMFYKIIFGTEPYYALSYTWGDLSAQTHSFICNGQELKIHRNLYEALPYLAKLAPNGPVWVDAICINQLDVKEKQMQIPLMNRIYAVAKGVAVWLGKPENIFTDDVAAEAVALLPRLAAIGADEGLKEMWRAVKDEASLEDAIRGLELPPLSASVWSCVFHIVCSPWFGRLWVVQEFILAEDITFLYGYNEINAETIENLWEPEHVDILKRISRATIERVTERESLEMRSGIFMLKKQFRGMDYILNDPYFGWQGEGRYRWYAHYLNIIVNFTAGRSCYDPRDRIFGVLGIVGDQLHGSKILSLLTYEQPLAKLFIYFFGFISNYTDLHPQYWHTLHQATRTNKMPGLPSWCPDLTRLPPSDIEAESFGAQDPQYVRWNADRPREIILRGAVLDSVAVVHPVWAECEDLQVLLARGTNYVEDLLSMAKVAKWNMEATASLFGKVRNTQEEFGNRISEIPQSSLNDYWRTILGSSPIQWLRPEKEAYQDITPESFDDIRDLLKRIMDFVNREESWLRQLLEAGKGDFGAAHQAAQAYLGKNEQDFLEHIYPLVEDQQHEIRPFSRFRAFSCAVLLCISDRRSRLITTSRGQLALGPYSAVEGDTFCVFEESYSSHLLRPSSSACSPSAQTQESGEAQRTSCYTLIGEAFVYNLRDAKDDPAVKNMFHDISLV